MPAALLCAAGASTSQSEIKSQFPGAGMGASKISTLIPKAPFRGVIDIILGVIMFRSQGFQELEIPVVRL